MSTTQELALGEIGQIALPVRDIEHAVEFYRDALGIRLLFQVPGMAFFDCGGVRLMLSAPDGDVERPGSFIYFRVPDIAGAFDTLSRRGVVFERGPQMIADMGDHELWLAFFSDPDRNPLALMSEVAKEG